MMDVVQANWLAFAPALAIGLLVAWWLFGRASTAPRRDYKPDVLDEGTAPAPRNQALIDAPSAALSARLADTGPDIFAGIGELLAAAAAREVQAAAGDGDDLSRIKGVGPKLVALLGSLGVTRFAQIAAWSEADIAEVDAKLGTFAGRIGRDSWVEQCKLLATGDKAGFEGKFGKL